jgi:multidrug efflux pump subunit AcrB
MQATGCSREEAILQAAPRRLRPILMTTITTVLGLFPLALGLGDGQSSFSPWESSCFQGLSLATVLTLFIIPCFYTLLHSKPWMGGKSFAEAKLPSDKPISEKIPY